MKSIAIICLVLRAIYGSYDPPYTQNQLAGVCSMYEAPVEEALEVPAGYEPWVISHYGRHGARLLTSPGLYDCVYDAFAYEASKDNLTEYGKSVYDKMLSIRKHFDGHAGELTQKGRQQHRDIAARMKARYPSVFKAHPQIYASSSTTPRCIQSMEAFCAQMGGKIPMRSDSADLKVMNPVALLQGCDKDNFAPGAAWKQYAEAYYEDLVDTAPFEKRLFKEGYTCPDMTAVTFEAKLFNIIVDLPCLDFEAPSFDGLFTPEEQKLLWEIDNVKCFHQTNVGMPGSDRLYSVCYPLLEEMITSADADLKSGKPVVRLRFGHDMTLSGLLALMEVEHWDKKASSYAQIKDVFQNWRIPMAENVQMVLYRSRKKGAEPLVRFCLHEQAIELPLPSVGDRLYRWDDFKYRYLGAVSKAYATLKEPACNFLFDIEQKFEGHPMQAFAIDKDTLYVGYDAGFCRTYDFTTGRLIAEFPMGCHIATNHCGNLNYAGGYLYVSGDLTNKSCYVQKMTSRSAATVQTIKFNLSNDFGGSQAVIDTSRSRIVYVQRRLKKINLPENEFIVYEFRLPSVSEGDLEFTDADVLKTYKLEKYFPVYQGATILDGKMYQSFGGSKQWSSSEGIGYAVFNIATGQLLDVVRVAFSAEPQSILNLDGRMLMNFNSHGFYEIVNLYDNQEMD